LACVIPAAQILQDRPPTFDSIHKKTRNIYYNNIGGSEGINKTSKSLANKISDKWDLKFKINHYFLKL
jgi:hypothetical protein